MADDPGLEDSSQEEAPDEQWRREWYETADAEARAKGYKDYEAFVEAEDEKRRAKASEPLPFDWRQDTRCDR